jgi:hypothetical protein
VLSLKSGSDAEKFLDAISSVQPRDQLILLCYKVGTLTLILLALAAVRR